MGAGGHTDRGSRGAQAGPRHEIQEDQEGHVHCQPREESSSQIRVFQGDDPTPGVADSRH